MKFIRHSVRFEWMDYNKAIPKIWIFNRMIDCRCSHQQYENAHEQVFFWKVNFILLFLE